MKTKIKITLLLTIFLCICVSSCKEPQSASAQVKQLDGKTILQKCIQEHGGTLFNSSIIAFKTKDIDYEMINYQHKVKYTMRKSFKEDLHVVYYDRGHVQYFINDSLRESNSYNNLVVNARLENFLYLLSIPFHLNFNGTKVQRLEDVSIRSKEYYSIHISFPKIEDLPENEFVLYIDKEDFQMNFLALKYDILGSPISFRKFMNPRMIDGVLFQDFISFFPKENSTSTLKNLYQEYNTATLRDTKPTLLNDIRITPITEDPFE